MTDRSPFNIVVAALTGSPEAASEPPDIPEVITDKILSAANRCWELLGREGTRAALNRMTVNQRTAVKNAIGQGGLADLKLNPLVLFHGLEHLSVAQHLALESARDALRILREFEAPGGAARYAAAPVESAIKDSRESDPTKPRLGRPPLPVPEAKSDAAIMAAITESLYLELPRRQKNDELRTRIVDGLGISRARFFAVLRQMKKRTP